MDKLSGITICEISPNDQVKLEAIGLFRMDVWRKETIVNEKLFPDGKWLEPLDAHARHWIAMAPSGIVGAARLTFHSTLQENPDGYLWEKEKRSVPAPVAHLCKLVVHHSARGLGIGKSLNTIRIKAAKEMGAKSIIVTASDKNSILLSSLGFIDTGIRETFPNRPGFPFKGLELIL